MSTADNKQAGPASTGTGDVSLEHVEDVFRVARRQIALGRAGAVAVITDTSGGAVRSPGAVMFVSDGGARYGYLSGGCIDADVAFQALRAMESGNVVRKAYGAGSGVADLPLPCGGRIDVTVSPLRELKTVERVLDDLGARRRSTYSATLDDASSGPVFTAVPKLRIRAAGKGADLVALAWLARAAGHGLSVQTPDEVTSVDLAASGIAHQRLSVAHNLPDAEDDPFTAFVLMFHDPDWETPLLAQALGGPAFYIGAVGNSAAHARRLEALRGVGATGIERIRGPIGLVPSTRNASDLAISTLAEVIGEFAGVRRAVTSSVRREVFA